MPLFAVIAFDKPRSWRLRDEHRDAHRAYSRDNEDTTRLAGAMYDGDGHQCGTLKIFEADSPEHLRELYQDEPFFKAGIYQDLRIIEWRLAFNQFPIVDYPAPTVAERAAKGGRSKEASRKDHQS